ncbi:MAG: FIST C-terminal domain-containing protein [Verrucomicrobiae bacterium]|nr:FIST C-terminal domain-containing protein [Verrucomicrobiae bacterium]
MNEFSVTAHWDGGMADDGLAAWAASLRGVLRAPQVTLGTVFMGPEFFDHATEVLEILRVHARIPLLAGCSGTGLVVNGQELEQTGGLVLGIYHLPGGVLRGVHFTQGQVEAAEASDWWATTTGISPGETNGWLVFADPFHIDGERWLTQWNEAYPRCPIVGGLASGPAGQPLSQVYLNGEVYEEGGVAVAVGGDIELRSVVSQGCTPIGQPWTITRAEGNLIHEIANRPAYQVLADTFNGLPPDEQRRAQGNLLVGLVANEYQEEFHRGDFLIRNLMGGDPKSGVLAVGARPRPGQSLQFQCRDAGTAAEDLVELFSRAKDDLSGRVLYGGCLCLCNGRGRHLFSDPHHDAGLTQEVFGPTGITGFFCNGELGPVGARNHLHGFTASLGLFVGK